MIKDFLIINCTGVDDKLGLRLKEEFFIHNFEKKIHNNDVLVSTILKFLFKYKVDINSDFSILVNNGPGSFSSIRVALSVAKGIKISKKINLFGYKSTNLPLFNLENIEKLINKNLLEKKLIKPIYLS